MREILRSLFWLPALLLLWVGPAAADGPQVKVAPPPNPIVEALSSVKPSGLVLLVGLVVMVVFVSIRLFEWARR